MTDVRFAPMDADERDAFLGTGGTGVISFAGEEGEPPHAVPVSYGYDAAEETFYFRLAVGEGSEKGDPSGRAVTFVVYGERDDGWRSVVAKGRLEATTEDSVATESLRGLEAVHIPFVDIFGRPSKELTFEFERLSPAELTSRKESSTAV